MCWSTCDNNDRFYLVRQDRHLYGKSLLHDSDIFQQDIVPYNVDRIVHDKDFTVSMATKLSRSENLLLNRQILIPT